MSEVKCNVSSNATHMEEAECHIHDAKSTHRKLHSSRPPSESLILNLKQIIWRTETRGGTNVSLVYEKTLLDFINNIDTQWLVLGPDRAFTLECSPYASIKEAQ